MKRKRSEEEVEKFNKQFNDKYETCDQTSAYLFTTTGCFNRHNRARAEQEMTLRENMIKSFSYYKTEDMADSILISYVAELQDKGIKIVEQTLEMYVLAHVDELDIKEVTVDRLVESVLY
jgi:hypothetical protein